MIIFNRADEVSVYLAQRRKEGAIIGFVPTMGALHLGHISLLQRSKLAGDYVVCSIFVNPTQFNDPKDFEEYPSSPDTDIGLLEEGGCDLLFLPGLTDIYPGGTKNASHYELGYLEKLLEGKFRPGHFQGVCQVVERLLTIISPMHLYLGQKDYQQCMVIKRLVDLMAINPEIVICPTLREPGGLAMSSRNMRLKKEEKIHATRLFETLLFIKREIRTGYLGDLKERARQYLFTEGFKVDYLEITEATGLLTIENWNGKEPLVALVAAFLNGVRLIDNMLL